MPDLFTLTSGNLPPTARVMGFHGTEAVSRCFSFDIYVSVTRHAGREVDLADAVGGRIGLSVTPPAEASASRPPYSFQGIVSAIELVNDVAERSVFKVTMVPQLWQLGQSIHSRVFTAMTIPAIITAILEENSIGIEDFELRLTHDYPIEEHVCQYKESDLAFVSRWMEREGMYYFFDHSGTSDRLIITDDRATAKRLSPHGTRYFPLQEGLDHSASEALHSVAYRHRSLPARVALSDYDYTKPGLDVSGSAIVSESGLGQVSIYGDRFFTPGEGKRLAELRAEALRAGQEVLTATGSARDLRSGYLFELEQHTRPSLNHEYFVTAVEHVGRDVAGASELDGLLPSASNNVYRATISAIPASVQFRSERVTPWPRITAFENGVVDGPANSQYAQIDSHGRYAVKLKFDESALKGGKASTWVRMAQPHGGGVEGFHFPLRKATEVLITFLGGDPDRPVIAGVLPNASTPSPVTAGNNTKNVIQTGGSSRMEIEDAAGGQYIHHSTPVANTMMWMGATSSPQGHNVELSTDGSGMHSFGTYFDQYIGGKKSEHVVGDVSRSYASDYATDVTGHVTKKYGADYSHSVKGAAEHEVKGSFTRHVIGPVKQTFMSTLGVSVTGDVKQEFLSAHSLQVTGEQSLKVTGAGTQTFNHGLSVTVNAAPSQHTANVGYVLEAKPDATMHATNAFDIRGDVTAKLSSMLTEVHGDASVLVDAGSVVTISATAIMVDGKTVLELRGGSTVEIIGGDIAITGGDVKIDATTEMKINASATLALSGAKTAVHGGPLVDVAGAVIKLNS